MSEVTFTVNPHGDTHNLPANVYARLMSALGDAFPGARVATDTPGAFFRVVLDDATLTAAFPDDEDDDEDDDDEDITDPDDTNGEPEADPFVLVPTSYGGDVFVAPFTGIDGVMVDACTRDMSAGAAGTDTALTLTTGAHTHVRQVRVIMAFGGGYPRHVSTYAVGTGRIRNLSRRQLDRIGNTIAGDVHRYIDANPEAWQNMLDTYRRQHGDDA